MTANGASNSLLSLGLQLFPRFVFVCLLSRLCSTSDTQSPDTVLVWVALSGKGNLVCQCGGGEVGILAILHQYS